MATITGLTAARMLEIEAATVVSGTIDPSGHLTLVQHDGTVIDAGYFPPGDTGVAGVVKLATLGQTDALTDATIAVTPAGLTNIAGRITTLEATSTKVLSGIAESALPTSYPTGLSLMSVGASSGWSLNSGFGTVVTNKAASDRVEQSFYTNTGGASFPRQWVRTYSPTDGGGGWTAWSTAATVATLTPASFLQSTAFTSYPQGESRLYYSSSTSSFWDFVGTAGEVRTFVDGTDFAKQVFTKHVGGSANLTSVWTRTANSTSGWTPWYKTPSVTLTGISSVAAVANTTTTLAVPFPAGLFTAAPVVVITVNSTTPGSVSTSASGVSTSGFTLSMLRTATVSTSVWWIAVE